MPKTAMLRRHLIGGVDRLSASASRAQVADAAKPEPADLIRIDRRAPKSALDPSRRPVPCAASHGMDKHMRVFCHGIDLLLGLVGQIDILAPFPDIPGHVI